MSDYVPPVLPAMQVFGKVEAVLITASTAHDSFVTVPVRSMNFTAGEGILGDRHYGPFRAVGARETALRHCGYENGHPIANYRMFSAVSVEELAEIAKLMDLPSIPFGCLGENLVLSGIPELTKLPAGTQLIFGHSDQKPACTLVTHEENKPCIGPGKAIQAVFPDIARLDVRFPKAAYGRRGLVGTVFVSGVIMPGMQVIGYVPKQRIYDPYAALKTSHE